MPRDIRLALRIRGRPLLIGESLLRMLLDVRITIEEQKEGGHL